jgi:formylglycine-generating enzyme required for sulfatase activity
VERLGEGWAAEEPDRAEDCLPVRHRLTDLRFVAIPGGCFEMGLSEADLEEASAHVDWTAAVASMFRRLARSARPVHPVDVTPFLCARSLLDRPKVKELSHGRLDFDALPRAEARSLAHSLGLRLPAEAELEWLMRDGGRTSFTLDAARGEKRSRFGVDKLFSGQWAEDDWHPNYDGAPAVSALWLDGDPNGVYRGGKVPEEMQSREELLFLLAGVRGYGKRQPSFVGVRLAADIPR